MSGSVIIDGHAHACGEYLEAANILAGLDRNGVDKVVLVPGERGSKRSYKLPDLAAAFPRRDVVPAANILIRVVIRLTRKDRDIEPGNARVRSLVEKHPDRIVQFYWVRLSSGGFEEALSSAFRKWEFKGIKLHQCWERFSIRGERFGIVARWAAERGLPVFLHLYSLRDVTELIHYIGDHPGTKFIIGHLFGLELYMKADLKSSNVWFDISAPPLVSVERLRRSIDHFGAGKILLGSDVPYGENNLARNIQRVRDLPISGEQKAMILGENMCALLDS